MGESYLDCLEEVNDTDEEIIKHIWMNDFRTAAVLSITVSCGKLFYTVLNRTYFNNRGIRYSVGRTRLTKRLFEYLPDDIATEVLKVLIQLENNKYLLLKNDFKNSDLYKRLLLDIII